MAALHAAGVDILVGTDVSVLWPDLGGMAHGASVHHAMQLLVQAGLSPIAALTAATATPARRFRSQQRQAFEYITRDWPDGERRELARLIVKYANSAVAAGRDSPGRHSE